MQSLQCRGLRLHRCRDRNKCRKREFLSGGSHLGQRSAMKTFSVSLLIRSSSLSLDEMSSRLGRPHSSGSHTKGEPHALEKRGRSPWSETVWRFDSAVSESAPVEDHIRNLEVEFPPDELRALLPADCSVCLDIAIFFDTANVSVSLPRRRMEIVERYSADLEVTCYPSKFPRPVS